MPLTYRKRPIVIEAMQWDGDNIADLWDWAGAANVYGPTEANPLRLYVAANEAWLDLETGEWIIRDSRGFYPCKAEVFEATYEPVAIDPMPVFTIKAKDKLAVAAIYAYRDLCFKHGLGPQALEVEKAIAEMRDWRRHNRGHVAMPDHQHVPVAVDPEEKPGA